MTRRERRRSSREGSRRDAVVQAAQDARRARPWRGIGLVFGLALIVRLLHVWQLRSAPFFDLLVGDSAEYDRWAQEIAAGDWLGSEIFYQAPLYPYLLGVFYSVAGHSLLALRIAQAVMGSAACALLADCGARLFSPRVGLAAGLMLAFYAPAIFADAIVQKSVLDLLLVCVLLWLMSLLVGATLDSHHRRLGVWLGIGMTLGCLSLTRENALVLVGASLIWIALQYRGVGARRWLFMGVVLGGLGIVLAPVAIRNQVVGGELVLTTSQFGPNFYIGNNPGADGTYRALRPGRGDAEYERTDATALAEQALGRRLTATEVSSYWFARARAYIRDQPGDWLALMLRKAILTWHAIEIIDTESQYTHAEWSWPLRLTSPVTHFGVVMPLVVLGAWATWTTRARVWHLYLLAALYASSVAVFYVFTRYRHPLVPFVLLFAAAGVVEAWRLLQAVPRRQVIGVMAAASAVAVVVNWPFLSADSMRAITHVNFGNAMRATGRYEEAMQQYQDAIRLDPALASAYSNLGGVLVALGRLPEAVAQYERAVALGPGLAFTHYNLANALVAEERFDEAIEQYRIAIEVDPADTEAQNNLGMALARAGRIDEAVEAFETAMRLAPEAALAPNNLGLLAEERGDLPRAMEFYGEALRRDPSFADAHRNLGTALMTLGRAEEAAGHLEKALERNPKDAEAHYAMGVLMAARGELAVAAEHFRRALAIDPTWTEARQNLLIVLEAQGRIDEAQAVREGLPGR